MNSRLSKELASLKSPPEGIVVFPTSPTTITAKFKPLLDSPYSLESAFFELSITIPARYPFEPPNIRFVTAIYHPNVDSQGRICHDLLKMPPIGGWSPAHNVLSVISFDSIFNYSPLYSSYLVLVSNLIIYNHCLIIAYQSDTVACV